MQGQRRHRQVGIEKIIRKIRHGRSKLQAFLFVSLLIGSMWAAPQNSIAALTGSGTAASPVTGDIQAGDLISPGAYVKNLTAQNEKQILLLTLYTPKQYALLFDANGGLFADKTARKEVQVVYNDGIRIYDAAAAGSEYQKENTSFLKMPETPVKEAAVFSGWYLKGNQRPLQNAGEKDGTIISDGSRYMIANDDVKDLEKTEHTADQKTIARALWRETTSVWPDGNEADEEGSGGSGGEGSGGSGSGGGSGTGGGLGSGKNHDLWDPLHSNNYVVEWIEGMPDKAAYQKKHGRISHQYRRIRFNAKTSLATGYRWYRKSAGAETYEQLSANESAYIADRLTRADHGSSYRCEVLIGTEGDFLCYETVISVYHLPEITGTMVTVNGVEQTITGSAGQIKFGGDGTV